MDDPLLAIGVEVDVDAWFHFHLFGHTAKLQSLLRVCRRAGCLELVLVGLFRLRCTVILLGVLLRLALLLNPDPREEDCIEEDARKDKRRGAEIN